MLDGLVPSPPQLPSTTSGNQPKLSDRSPKCLVKEKPYHIDTISIPSNVITKSQVTCKKARKASQKNKGNYIGSKYYGPCDVICICHCLQPKDQFVMVIEF